MLLAHAPRLTVVITSRTVLRLSGEHEYQDITQCIQKALASWATFGEQLR
jgi:hypothetical protein